MTTGTTRPQLNAAFLRAKHEAAVPYDAYLATNDGKAEAWRAFGRQVTLPDAARTLVAGFVREMKVLCISGIWCGDCVQQGPLLQAIASASDRIDLRWLDRDEHLDLAELVKINAGLRVPVVLFMAEDHEPVSIAGDRSLSRYRALAAKNLGGACPLPGAPAAEGEITATLQDWLEEFERVHLLLRLSGRLRQLHGD